MENGRAQAIDAFEHIYLTTHHVICHRHTCTTLYTHWEYQSLSTEQLEPAAHAVGPLQSLPPH